MNGTGEKPSGVISVPSIVGGLRGCTKPHTLLRRIANTTRPRPAAESATPTMSSCGRRSAAGACAICRRTRRIRITTTVSAGEHVPPRELGRHPAADQRARGDRDRGDPAEQRVRQRPLTALIRSGRERRDRRHHEHGAEPLDPRPADQQHGEVRAQRRRERPDPIDHQPERERPVGAQDVAELRPEQHERRHHQRVHRDRRLHALDRRVEVLDDLRDRHVHDARIEHHHELRRGKDDHRKPLAHERPSLSGRGIAARRGVLACCVAVPTYDGSRAGHIARTG